MWLAVVFKYVNLTRSYVVNSEHTLLDFMIFYGNRPNSSAQIWGEVGGGLGISALNKSLCGKALWPIFDGTHSHNFLSQQSLTSSYKLLSVGRFHIY
jgi:hypothetical protein